jgi:hypothetical protein
MPNDCPNRTSTASGSQCSSQKTATTTRVILPYPRSCLPRRTCPGRGS